MHIAACRSEVMAIINGVGTQTIVVPWQNDHGLLEALQLFLDKQHRFVKGTIMVKEVTSNQYNINGFRYGTIHNGL
jgi:hypothetical protein